MWPGSVVTVSGQDCQGMSDDTDDTDTFTKFVQTELGRNDLFREFMRTKVGWDTFNMAVGMFQQEHWQIKFLLSGFKVWREQKAAGIDMHQCKKGATEEMVTEMHNLQNLLDKQGSPLSALQWREAAQFCQKHGPLQKTVKKHDKVEAKNEADKSRKKTTGNKKKKKK